MKTLSVLLLILVLAISSICGFIGAIFLFDLSINFLYPVVVALFLGVGSAILLQKLARLKMIYWMLLFPANGLMAGVFWAALPIYNDGAKILIVSTAFIFSALGLHMMKKSGLFNISH